MVPYGGFRVGLTGSSYNGVILMMLKVRECEWMRPISFTLPLLGFGSVGCRCFTNVASRSNRMLVDGFSSGAIVSRETWTGFRGEKLAKRWMVVSRRLSQYRATRTGRRRDIRTLSIVTLVYGARTEWNGTVVSDQQWLL